MCTLNCCYRTRFVVVICICNWGPVFLYICTPFNICHSVLSVLKLLLALIVFIILQYSLWPCNELVEMSCWYCGVMSCSLTWYEIWYNVMHDASKADGKPSYCYHINRIFTNKNYCIICVKQIKLIIMPPAVGKGAISVAFVRLSVRCINSK